jgi:hypothetical protein
MVHDGAYQLTATGPRSRRVALPTSAKLEVLLGQIVKRSARQVSVECAFRFR